MSMQITSKNVPAFVYLILQAAKREELEVFACATNQFDLYLEIKDRYAC